MSDQIVEQEKREGLMRKFLVDTQKRNEEQKRQRGKKNNNQEGQITTEVEPGKTVVKRTRREVPSHLEFIGKIPEKVAIGEKRTDWDPIKK